MFENVQQHCFEVLCNVCFREFREVLICSLFFRFVEHYELQNVFE